MKRFVVILFVLLFQFSVVALGQNLEETELRKEIAMVSGPEKVISLCRLSAMLTRSNLKESIEIAGRALDLARDIADATGEVRALHALGAALIEKGEYADGKEYLENSLEKARKQKDEKGITDALNTLATLYERMGEYDHAMEQLTASLEITEKGGFEGAKENQAAAYANLAIIYYRTQKPEQTLTYFERALNVYREIGDQQKISAQLNNLAVINRVLGRPQEALRLNREALQIRRKINDVRGMADSHNNIAIILWNQKDYTGSEEHHLQALKYREQAGDRMGIAQSLSNLAELYAATNRRGKALVYYGKSLDISTEINARGTASETYRVMSELLSDMGRYKEALSAYRSYTEIRNEMLDEKSRNRIAELNTQFEMKQKEQEIALLKQQQKNNRFVRDAAILGGLMLLGILVLLVNRFRLKNQANRIIEEKNRELQELSRTDPLTGLMNRRGASEFIQQEKIRHERSGKPMTFLMTDIDDFKKINDSCGHDCGDMVLREIAALFKGGLRGQDGVFRWGGEEFLIALPETGIPGAEFVADKLRQNVEQHSFCYQDRSIDVTMTFGISILDHSSGLEPSISRADEALYAGKRKGKNCLVVFGREV